MEKHKLENDIKKILTTCLCATKVQYLIISYIF